ncbi:MAG: hypothetical protein IT165_06165 [Bryobacterales bacterium]|nr:hypothetical protein [Bryobacterales bacterium]
MPSTARMQEILIGFGKGKQADISTANAAPAIWRLNKLNASTANPKLNTETDAEEYGKGHEFPTTVYKTSWDVGGAIEKYLSAEIAVWAVAFGLGKVVKSGSAPNFTYTCTPLNPVSDGIELPYFSFIEQMRPGGSAVLDRMAVGCAVEDWTITIGSGPGRANSKITINFAGSGKLTEPSGVVLPAATAEKLLPSASMTLSINGTDYVTSKNIVSVECGWKNNIRMDSGFFPGSGFQTPGDGASGAIRGRLECGNRQASLKFSARFANGSTELTTLKNQTTGTAVLGLSIDANNSLEITFPKNAFSSAEVGETDGLVTVAVECAPLYDDTNGLISAVAKCGVDGIGQ